MYSYSTLIGVLSIVPKIAPKDSDSKATIKIPRHLYNRLREVIAGSGFDSVTDFTVYVLRDLASGEVEIKKTPPSRPEVSLAPAEVEAVRKRLKNLGYL